MMLVRRVVQDAQAPLVKQMASAMALQMPGPIVIVKPPGKSP